MTQASRRKMDALIAAGKLYIDSGLVGAELS